MVSYLARKFPQAEICISVRNRTLSSKLEGEWENVRAFENQTVLDNSDVVFICLLAQQAREVLPSLEFREHQEIISVMADMGLEELKSLTTPVQSHSVTLPVPFISEGECPLPVFPDSKILRSLFGDDNYILPMEDEASVFMHFAATALLSTVTRQLNTVSDWLGESTGDKKQAEIYMLTLFSGFLKNIPKDGDNQFPEALKELSTEGGLNWQLINHIEESGHFDVLVEGLNGLRNRLLPKNGSTHSDSN